MNETSFLEMIREHQKIIHKVCHLYRDSIHDREDLFQEIVYQLWKSAGTFRGEAKASTWIYRISLNTAIASFRRKQPALEYTPLIPDSADELRDADDTQREHQLFVLLKQLDESERAIVALYFEEMSYKQIAEVTGLTENHVGVKLNRIKNKLKNLQKKAQYGTE